MAKAGLKRWTLVGLAAMFLGAVVICGAVLLKAGGAFNLRLSKPGDPASVDTDKIYTATIEDESALVDAADHLYIKLAKTNRREAIAAGGRFLDAQKIVKSWKLDKDRNELWVFFVDGQLQSAMLPWP